MALFAIGDLHLTLNSEKRMEEFDDVWIEHEKKIKENFSRIIRPEDTVVLTGDHTWGGHLSTCIPDIEFICSLPGRKILLRGNHDIFWQYKKTEELRKLYQGKLEFLQNNFIEYGDYALIGSKGYCYEPWDKMKDAKKRAAKRYRVELNRLQLSYESAKKAGFEKFIIFLHYPPTEIESSGNEYGGYPDSCFTRFAENIGADKVIYSHLHGKNRFNDSITGMKAGVEYSLVSADFLDFKPLKILG